MKFVLISMLSAIAFVSQTESLRVDKSNSNFLSIIKMFAFPNTASRIIDADVLIISLRVNQRMEVYIRHILR